MIPAKGCIKNYHWGKVGDDSYIARFQSVAPKSPTKSNGNNLSNVSSQSNKQKLPLAELWFGSHPSGPARLKIGDHLVRLNEFLDREPEMVGVIERYIKYNKQLPFLFKILSVAQPLSLQVHPDKKMAHILHKSDPKNYPDPNHKPELAIALTEFEILCDFRPHKEILRFLKSISSLRRIVGENNFRQYQDLVELKNSEHNFKVQVQAALAECFISLMESSKDDILRETKSLLSEHNDAIGKDLTTLTAGLTELYPGDPGIFAPFFLNYIKLAPGQAVFLKANKLHAYLRGECIECMACSDNVVRAGLTTKFRDVHTLISMLDYEAVSNAQDLILPPTSVTNENVTTSSFAPTEEFKVEKIVINPKDSSIKEFSLPAVLSGSFVIVLNGKAKTKDFFDLRSVHKLCFGSAGFIPPKIALNLYDIQGTLVLYRAYC